MPRRYKPNQSGKAFVLLQSLWLLLLASLLSSAMMAASLSVAKDGEAAIMAFRSSLAAESGIYVELYNILMYGSKSTRAPPAAPQVMKIDGIEVSITTRDVSGLVDLNATDTLILLRLLDGLAVSEANKKITGMIAARPITSYPALAAIDGMTQNIFDTLLPHITLFSRQSVPSTTTASLWLTQTLHLRNVSPSVVEEDISATGHTFRIEAKAKTQTGSSQRLVAEVLITGRRDQPFFIYEWSWHPL